MLLLDNRVLALVMVCFLQISFASLLEKRAMPLFIRQWQLWHTYSGVVNQVDPFTAPTIPASIPYGYIGSNNGKISSFLFQAQPEDCDNTNVQAVKVLGEGSYGVVYKGKVVEPASQAGTFVAVKYTKSRNPTARMLTGARIQSSIDSQYVLKVYGYFQTQQGTGGLITPIIAGGGLRDQTIDIQGVGESMVNKVFKQILQGVSALHSRRVMHRDIKPDNILWDGTTAYIADMDTASTESSTREIVVAKGDGIGTPGYISPEQLNLQMYTKSVDVFAVGMTWVRMNVNEMWEGKPFLKFWKAVVQPVSGNMYNTPQEVSSILQEYEISRDMRNLLKDVLCGPAERITIDQFLARWRTIKG
ncbi:serine/threonine protein kinase [Penicillium taxi]|uniref:serine/threonine protein kinase n=1 Tax=Penicillium taxi TaxID=168475 RepID=UPI002545A850|nr:serine/threonine protein kinase [Penicillium taxi]KAJ5898757.1 serine/threonine protein kinase [Penicillium taxi]